MNNDLPSDTTSILIVDSDRNITTLLHDCLAAEGYTVDVYTCAEDALRQPLEGYRMIISEVNLAEISGFELLERLKDAPLTANIPFIFCSEEDSESTVIDALNAGADDYIVKPFSLRTMIARIKSIMRRHRNVIMKMPSATLEYKTLAVNLENNAVTISGTAISLTPTEMQILLHIFRNRNKLFNREEIQRVAWPGQADISPRAVDVNISRLRKKLGDYGANIVSRTGFGYGFME